MYPIIHGDFVEICDVTSHQCDESFFEDVKSLAVEKVAFLTIDKDVIVIDINLPYIDFVNKNTQNSIRLFLITDLEYTVKHITKIPEKLIKEYQIEVYPSLRNRFFKWDLSISGEDVEYFDEENDIFTLCQCCGVAISETPVRTVNMYIRNNRLEILIFDPSDKTN